MEPTTTVDRRPRAGEDGALSPGFLLFIVAAAVGSMFLVQLAHAGVLRTGAHTAAEAAALAAAEELRVLVLAGDGWGPGLGGTPPVVTDAALASAAGSYAARNDADLTGFARNGCRVRADVRGRTGVTAGPSPTLQQGRPESRAAAELAVPPLGASGLAFSCAGGLSIVDEDLLPPGLSRPDEFDEDPPDPDDFDEPEDFEEALEAWEDARDAAIDAVDAWRNAVRGWAFGHLRNHSEVRLIPAG
jgi:hypothetical protein